MTWKIANSKVKHHWHAMLSLSPSLAHQIIIQHKIWLIPIEFWCSGVDMSDRTIVNCRCNAFCILFCVQSSVSCNSTQQAMMLWLNSRRQWASKSSVLPSLPSNSIPGTGLRRMSNNVLLLGGATIKKTTNKIWLTLSISQNQICGLAVCLIFFWWSFPRFQKRSPKMRKQFRLGTSSEVPVLSITSPVHLD